MKVIDILKHSNANKTTIVDNTNKDTYQVWGIIDYEVDGTKWDSAHSCYIYGAYSIAPKELLNLTVDFIAPWKSDITIYTK